MRLAPLNSIRWFVLCLLGPSITFAQVITPAPPATFDVQIRYRILGDRNERVLQFESMLKGLADTGFTEKPDEDNDLAAFDPTAEMMIGTAPSRNARRILKDARVQTILLAPAGFKVPVEPEARVRVALELNTNREQLALFNQIDVALNRLGFRKDIGYDTRKFTFLRGSIPAGKLPLLLRDLRSQPSGWFFTDERPELTLALRDGTPTPELVKPFADTLPIRVVEVLGLSEPTPAIVGLPPIPADQPQQEKWTADLRRKLAEEGAKDKPIRLEVVLSAAPTDLDYEWRENLIRSGATIEGRVGSVVTLTVAQGSKAAELAAGADVVSVRLPRLSRAHSNASPAKRESRYRTTSSIRIAGSESLPAESPDEDPLKITRLQDLHALGVTGQGKRIVIIDTDFAGWREKFPEPKAGSKGPKVRLLDLTAERNRNVYPDAMPGQFGHGTHCALAVRLAAPSADLILVRIPADAPYQLLNVARSIRGDLFRTEGIISRRNEVQADIELLRTQIRDANLEHQRAFDNFDDTPAAEKRRVAAQENRKNLITAEKGTLEHLRRIEELELGLASLKNSHVIVCLLNWNTGFALDGASSISRFLDDWLTRSNEGYHRHLTRPNAAPAPIWIQSAGDTRGQSWTGLFRDTDANGAMEFATSAAPLQAGRWSRELNFLSVVSDGKSQIDLKEGSKVRLSIQWREPHDPELAEFEYRVPVVPLKLQLIKQRDPLGEKAASDEIDVIAESEGPPERLLADPNFGVYEHSLEITLPADGRYALRIEGKVPNRIRPVGVPTLEAQEIRWELRPRVFVESTDGKSQFQLADFASDLGGVAVPGDANSVLTIGSAGKDRQPRSFSASGSGTVRELAGKPNFLAPDVMPKFSDEPSARGTDLSASFAAGWAASLLSGGASPSLTPQSLNLKPGTMIEVPEGWLRRR